MLQIIVLFITKRAIIYFVYTLYIYEDNNTEIEKMGFLIAAFRKLSLRRTINNKQYEQTLLNVKLEQIHNNISIMQQAKASAQNAFQGMMSSMSSMNENIFSTQYNALQGDYQKRNSDYQKILSDAGNDTSNPAVVEALKKLNEFKEAAGVQSQQLYMQSQSSRAAFATASQVMNSIFANSDKAQLDALQREETRMSQQVASNETQLTLLNEEYKSVTELEKSEAKNSVAHFGLA